MPLVSFSSFVRRTLPLCAFSVCAACSRVAAQSEDAFAAMAESYRNAPDDTSKIKAALPLATSYANAGKHSEAAQIGREATALAQGWKGTKFEAYAYSMSGYARAQAGYPEEGLQLIDSAMGIARSLKRVNQMIDLSYMAGVALDGMGKRQQAIQRYLDAYAQLSVATRTDTATMRDALLGKLAEDYLLSKQNAAALPCINQLIQRSRSSNDEANLTFALGQLGRYYYEQGDNQKALRSLSEELKLARKLGLPNAENEANFHLANVYTQLGDFPKSVAAHQRVIRYTEAQGYKPALCAALVNLAEVYAAHKLYDDALRLYARAMPMARSLNSDVMVAATLHNIADARFRKGAAQAADSIARIALKMNERSGNEKYIAQNHFLLGEIAQSKKRWEGALSHYEKGAQIAGRLGLATESANAAKYIGLLYVAQGGDSSLSREARVALGNKAIDYLKKAEAGSKAAGSRIGMEDVHSGLSAAYKLAGDYQTSLDELRAAERIHDSLYSRESAFKIARLENEVALAQKDTLLHNKAIEAAALRRRQLYIVGIGAGLLLLAGAAFFIYKMQRSRREKLAKAEMDKRIAEVEMQALRAQMNPHFIFNCLNSINRYIVKSDAVTASGYLTKFAKLIRFILDNSAATAIPLEVEQQMLTLYTEMESLRFKHRFTYSVEIEEGLPMETMFIPPMLVQPYVENAIWHGLMHKREGGHLSVRFSEIGKGLLQAVVEDDGIGRAQSALLKSKTATKEKSHGMRITGDRLRIVNEQQGTEAGISIEDLQDSSGAARGTRVTIQIPYSLRPLAEPAFSLS